VIEYLVAAIVLAAIAISIVRAGQIVTTLLDDQDQRREDQ
jgi:hypothetical protein